MGSPAWISAVEVGEGDDARPGSNFNKIAPFGKEGTAKELQDHAVENAEVGEIKRAVFCALTRLRIATIKEFNTIASLETKAIDSNVQRGCLHCDVVWCWKFHSRWCIRFSLGQPHTACSGDSKQDSCADADWTCRLLNMTRISGTFGEACLDLDRHPAVPTLGKRSM